MLVAVIQQRGDLGLLSLTALLQAIMWGSMTGVYWYKREHGKTSVGHQWLGALDIWICTILAIAWTAGLILFFIALLKKGFSGACSRVICLENAWGSVAAILFLLSAALAVSGRMVMLFSYSVSDLGGLLSFCMGSLLAYIALLLTSVCLLVGRAALA